ncbi:MAG: helix-hairpin-helix domain-containing protein [Promethearchaeota archaeon]
MSKPSKIKKNTKKEKEEDKPKTPKIAPAPKPKPPKPSEAPKPKDAKPKAPETTEAPKMDKVMDELLKIKTLNNLSIETIDGIGPKVTNKLKEIKINTLEDLMQANPTEIYQEVKIPVHKVMEYQKKAEKILELELDDEILNALTARKYTIEQTIEENPKKLIEITKRDKDQIKEFLDKVMQVTMFLDANTCRTNSIGILHRAEKKPAEVPKEPPKPPLGKPKLTLDTLSVETVDGIGPKIEDKLRGVGIRTLDHLSRANPVGLYKLVKLPIHRMMEYRKKAQMILQLELDGKIIDTLEEKDYTIEKAIEEDPEIIRKMTGRDKEQVMDFIENVVQITMFLDANTCRTNSVGILHKSKKEEKPEAEVPEYEEIRYLGKDQILAKIYSTELAYTVLKLLRERARNKTEIQKIIENKLMKVSLRELNDVIDLLVQTELVQLEWFEGNFDVHLFLISDFAIFRTPAFKIIKEIEKHLPTPLVAQKYLKASAKYFDEYKPTSEDNLFIAELLRDPDIFVTLTLLRDSMYPLKKFPKGGFGDSKINLRSIIDRMIDAGIAIVIPDETKKEWVLLLTDIRVPQFYPEYMLENIRQGVSEHRINDELALKHLDLLEIHYDTFYEIYSKFFVFD